MLPADLLVGMEMCTFKMKMLAAVSVMCVEHQPETSHRFTDAAAPPLQNSLVQMKWAGQSTPLQAQQLRIKPANCKHTKHLVHSTNPSKNQPANIAWHIERSQASCLRTNSPPHRGVPIISHSSGAWRQLSRDPLHPSPPVTS